MIYFYLLYILMFCQCHSIIHGFYLNTQSYDRELFCRDNDNRPVDWWYLYKPPKNTGRYLDSGGNFTFITSELSGRLQPSRTLLTDVSMLKFTMAPMYQNMFRRSMAVMTYGEKFSRSNADDLQASTALGIIFGNKFGGILISHTIPSFSDITRTGPLRITEEDYSNGHMAMCLTLSIETLNTIAAAIKHTQSKIIRLDLPESLSLLLPEWAKMETETTLKDKNSSKTKLLSFTTKNKTLQGKILARGPDDPRCLYNTFAKLQGIVLDVYNSNHKYLTPICQSAYSLRYIDKISIKFPEQQVYYIDRKQDRMSFAVSTGAVWQRTSLNSKEQQWTCTGNHDHQRYMTKGGLLICVNDYSVWFGFDNLKTKEPEC